MMPNDLSLTTAEGFLINPPDLRSIRSEFSFRVPP
jgi:hypothetical protein